MRRTSKEGGHRLDCGAAAAQLLEYVAESTVSRSAWTSHQSGY